MRKLYVIALLAILVVQPFVIMAAIPEGSKSSMSSDRYGTLSQEPGSRLGTGEYTNHVPFVIDGDADFDSQGWPGSGTEGDPYIIAGLRIVADLDMICISIMNTDLYFVIRDCYVEQQSLMESMLFNNTSHGTIEYVTVNGSQTDTWLTPFDATVRLLNANNTLVSHTASYGGTIMGLYANNSFNTVHEWSLFNSTDHRAFRVDNAEYLTVDHCEFYNYHFFGFWCTRFDNVNHTTITNSEMYSDGGVSGIAIEDSHFSSISDTYIWAPGADHGLNVDNCPNISLSRLVIEFAVDGADIDNSPGMIFSDSIISETVVNGIEIDQSEESSLSNITVYDTGLYGFYLFNDSTTSLTNCLIDTTGSTGIYSDGSNDLLFDGVTMMNTGSDGFFLADSHRPVIVDSEIGPSIDGAGLYADSCDNGTITNSRVEDTSSAAIDVTSSDNWMIADNVIIDITDIGIYVSFATNVEVVRNSLSVLTDNAIRIDWCPDAQVVNNTISEVDSETISVSDSQRILIDGNILTLVYSGIIVDNSDNITVSSNTITDTMSYGIHLDSLDNPTVSLNSLTALYGRGISVSTVLLGVFENNTMTDCGIWFNHGLAFQYYNHTLTGNTANGKPVLYEQNLNNADLTADDYGQIILLNCTFIEIANGSFTRATTAVQLFACEEVLIESLMLDTNWRAMTINTSDNVTIREVTVVGGEDDYRGIYMRYSDRTYIDNVTVSDCTGSAVYGVMFSSSDFGTVNNSVFMYNYYGIRWESSDNITVANSEILHSESYAIYAWGSASQYALIDGNTILNATRGFYSTQAQYQVVRNNLIMYCSGAGIYYGGASGDFGDVFHNTIENNQDGIYVQSSDFVTITNNTIRWNSGYGIYLAGSAGPAVYYNIIALSENDNGFDSNAGNSWDDGAVLGNWWDDWSGSGPYDVDNANTWDNYPRLYAPTEPIINQPQDTSYAEGSTGNEITWRVFDDSLRDWEVWIDGALWEADAWDFVDITVNVDGLTYGTHNVVVTVWDIDQNNVTDTLVIDVFDDTPPTINGPANGVAFVGGTGQTLVWAVADLNPGTYVVTLDEVDYEMGTWTTGEIVVGIDGLVEGAHTFRMTIYDLDSNSAPNSVLILAVDDGDAPIVDSPADVSFVEGSIGNAIVWTPMDEYPSSFEVSFNGSIIASEDWGGSRITVNVDDLPAGTHSMTLTVYDGTGNSASDTVGVTVIPVAPVPTPVQPLDLGVVIILVVGAGGVVAVVVIVFLIRKRRSS
ncbi:MAG: right-handed parallel beta-helix repeat-containing protein [Candidatus Thorarchaeota archaeon]